MVILQTNTPYVTSMDGVQLNESLMDFSSSLTKKRFEFWDHVKKGTPMQSVRYENIHMLPNDQEDDSIGCYSEAEDFEEDD